MRAMCFLLALAISWMIPSALMADEKSDRERKVKVALALAAASKAKISADGGRVVAPMPREKGEPVKLIPTSQPKIVPSHFIRTDDGQWIAPDGKGGYVYVNPPAASGVAAAPRPFVELSTPATTVPLVVQPSTVWRGSTATGATLTFAPAAGLPGATNCAPSG